MMTYWELAERIANMTEEQKNQNVTVLVSGDGEYYPLVRDYPLVQADDSNDQIDSGHFYMVI